MSNQLILTEYDLKKFTGIIMKLYTGRQEEPNLNKLVPDDARNSIKVFDSINHNSSFKRLSWVTGGRGWQGVIDDLRSGSHQPILNLIRFQGTNIAHTSKWSNTILFNEWDAKF